MRGTLFMQRTFFCILIGHLGAVNDGISCDLAAKLFWDLLAHLSSVFPLIKDFKSCFAIPPLTTFLILLVLFE